MKKDKIISMPCIDEARKKSKENKVIYSNIQISEEIKKLNSGKKYLIKTFGCQANVRDSETLSGLLESANFELTESEKDADVIVINTCAVRENAEDKVFGEIGNLKVLSDKTKKKVFAICGCMVEEPEVVERIKKIFPHINLIMGTHEVPYILDYIEELMTKDISRIISVKSQSGDIVENLPSRRIENYKAFVNIMYGCNKFCTYCIVPYTRGRERSRLLKDILLECEELVKNGYKEITLLGQNVNAYGKDLKDGNTFAILLEEVAKLGIPRLRFTTSHPWDFSSDVIDVIAKYPNIMKAIHLPVQSGNDDILKKMGRRYTANDYRRLVDEMKTKIKDLTISTDIIVGFPNETYEQFLDTLKMVDYVKYDSAFTFIYSPRPGTPAAKMEDNVSKEEKHRRFNELVDRCELYIAESSNKMIGGVYSVLVDGRSKTNPEMLSGYTESNKIVHFKSPDDLTGQIVKVKIKEAHIYFLNGDLIDG
ncbi:MAG: tRNA (N6-isopentenyl adenosine(37)-C2)-methylthiotransferase MiaB [Erysipelotrichaceae bacterium]|nr:tRNA (N6-isopentenyl adenosine(37)-C2)-methylthiotransferase MiaB [Erysipelotrichaceae bacterium]